MSQRPKRGAVTNREDTDTLLHLQKRRTTAEVQRDKELAASVKATANAQKEMAAAQKKNRVAAFEDQLREEDQQQEKKMTRPDLAARKAKVIFFLHQFQIYGLGIYRQIPQKEPKPILKLKTSLQIQSNRATAKKKF